jgi:hypothetical protein
MDALSSGLVVDGSHHATTKGRGSPEEASRLTPPVDGIWSAAAWPPLSNALLVAETLTPLSCEEGANAIRGERQTFPPNMRMVMATPWPLAPEVESGGQAAALHS